jgi:hypothetical protein
MPARAIILLLIAVSALAACGGGGSSRTQFVPNPPTPTITPQVATRRLSVDTFTNPTSQHATEVEPTAWAQGSTVVTAFQVGRIFNGGGADIGFATSTDAANLFTSGVLPGITIFQGGSNAGVSDPAVAFDAKHSIWLLSSLALGAANRIIVNRSLDGLNWGGPIVVSSTPDADKNWIACDNAPFSAFFGHCYLQWDDPSVNGLIWMSTSTDGGLTWQPAVNTADHAAGIGGQPVLQPNGTVVVPIQSVSGGFVNAFRSRDGGQTWDAPSIASTIIEHGVAASLRTSALPSAAVDVTGRVYVVWQDCRFRANCVSNDMVLSTSTDGVTFTAPVRIPIDAATSSADHFIPGLAADPVSGGRSTHLGLTYYFYPQTNCTVATCQLAAGFITSQDAGDTWSAPITLAGPMSISSLPDTFAGRMVGDYMATAFVNGRAFPMVAIANSASAVFDEAIYTTTTALTSAAQTANAFDREVDRDPVPGVMSDVEPRQFVDQEHRVPVDPAMRPPSR